MTSPRTSPFRALLQCLIGGALIIGLIVVLCVGLPWETIGHALGVGLSAVGQALWWVFKPVLKVVFWTLYYLWRGVCIALSWPSMEWKSFAGVMGLAALTLGCLLYKLANHQLELTQWRERRWVNRTGMALTGVLIYSFCAGIGTIGAYVDDSWNNYATDKALHRQILAMQEQDKQPSFSLEDRVRQANQALDAFNQYPRGEEPLIMQPLIGLVDANTAEFQAGTLSRGTCMRLFESKRFVPVTVNGQPVHTASDLPGACHYAWHNAAVLHGQPDQWQVADANTP